MKMKKFVALLLATLMVFSLFAVNTVVFAEDAPAYDAEVLNTDGEKAADLNLSDLCSWNDSAAKMEAWDGYTIKLLKDVELTSEVFLVGNITIDGNGFRLTTTAASGRLFNAASDAAKLGDDLNNNNEMTFKTLTIKNLEAEAKEIVAPYYGTVVLEEGNDMLATGTMFSCNLNNGAHFIFNGGSYTVVGQGNTSDENIARVISTGQTSDACGVVFDIYGGTYTSRNNAIIAQFRTNCTLNVYGGVFLDESYGTKIIDMLSQKSADLRDDMLVNIYDGYFGSYGNGRIMVVMTGTMNFYNGIVEDINSNRSEGDLFTVRGTAKLNVYGGRIIHTPKGSGDLADGVEDGIQNQVGTNLNCPTGWDALPQTLAGASVRMVAGSEGIRFESQIPAALVALAESLADEGTEVSYGTLIVPTDTIAEQAYLNMNTLRMLGLEEGKDYVDIVAKDGMTLDEEGNVHLRAALVNIRKANYGLALSAVSYIRYIKDGHEVTVCSDYVAGDHSRSMAYVAQKALEDVKDTAVDEYRYLNENGKYSPYTKEQRDALKVYLGLDA